MLNSKYKIRKDLSNNDFITVDYLGLCEVKGIKPITKTPKRRIRNLASIYSYPDLYTIADKAKFTKPLGELASSERLTAEYVKHYLTTNHLKINKDAKGVAY